MNKINKLFKEKNNNILSVYFTAGFPSLNDTAIIIKELADNGVDMIEVGMPFSDPLADGPTIQHTSEVALSNGMTMRLLFDQLKKIEIKKSKAAILLMGYLNPVLQYGIEKFCQDASALGVDGVILPDLPMQEYLDEYKHIFEKHDLKNVFLITPQTSEERIRFIDEHSDGFIYMVSSASTTGAKSEIQNSQEAYFKRIKAMKLKNPTIIGFGISDAKTFEKACEYANGAIIGSAFVKAVANSNSLKKDIETFVKGVKTSERV
ncbi:MAG TPA: tryptophan synthase subunit alpha [Bacteroidia bacterium]|nr:tryptophan synthase subunit alpha [Bacteroidia bacterium]HRG52679.1 tryptophan synthase subunit alpha [Bacteroidia bacterium]